VESQCASFSGTQYPLCPERKQHTEYASTPASGFVDLPPG